MIRPKSAANWTLLIALLFGATEALPAEHFRLIRLDGANLKWGRASFGSGARITYFFVPTAYENPEARNCRHIVPLTGLADKQGIAMAAVEAAFRQAVQAWEKAANVRFTAAASMAEADILIGAQRDPRGRAFTNVEYAPGQFVQTRSAKEQAGQARARPLTRSMICLNPATGWKIGFDGDLSRYDLRYTFIHELGHAIGLDHPSPDGSVMSFRYDERQSDPVAGDIAGAQLLYGPPAVSQAIHLTNP